MEGRAIGVNRPSWRVLVCAALSCVVAVGFAAPGVAAGRKNDVRAEVRALNRAYHGAVHRHDARAVANLYVRGARFFAFPSGPIHGRAAIRRHFVTLFRKFGLCGFSFSSRQLTAGGSLVVDFLSYTTSLCKAGKVQRVSGPGVLVFVRQRDHRLRILYDVFNTAPAPASR